MDTLIVIILDSEVPFTAKIYYVYDSTCNASDHIIHYI